MGGGTGAGTWGLEQRRAGHRGRGAPRHTLRGKERGRDAGGESSGGTGLEEWPEDGGEREDEDTGLDIVVLVSSVKNPAQWACLQAWTTC